MQSTQPCKLSSRPLQPDIATAPGSIALGNVATALGSVALKAMRAQHAVYQACLDLHARMQNHVRLAYARCRYKEQRLTVAKGSTGSAGTGVGYGALSLGSLVVSVLPTGLDTFLWLMARWLLSR